MINEAGLDGMAWLHCEDQVESLVVIALSEVIFGLRDEANKAANK